MLIFIGFRFWLHLSDILKRATGSKPDAVLVWRMRCARMASKHVENDRYWRVVNVQEVGWYISVTNSKACRHTEVNSLVTS